MPGPHRDLRVFRGERRLQIAALPFRREDGEVRVLLISSRGTKRWVVPKGWPMRGRLPHHAAALEALEEAGLVGRIAVAPIGFYTYPKRLKTGAIQPCEVDVYPLEVAKERKVWPEKGQRTRRWFSIADAAAAVAEPELSRLIAALGEPGSS